MNQTILLSSAGATPAGSVGTVNGAITVNQMINQSGTVIDSANFTVSGIVITTATNEFNNTNVNVTYTNLRDSAGLVNTDNVIANISGGFNTFFTFSNTFFTIAAIVLLIFMFLGLLAIGVTIMKMQHSGSCKGGFAE